MNSDFIVKVRKSLNAPFPVTSKAIREIGQERVNLIKKIENAIITNADIGKKFLISNYEETWKQMEYVINHVRAIENIVRGSFRQFQEGGSTAPDSIPARSSSSTPAGMPIELIEVLIDMKNLLIDLQENGVRTILEDDDIIRINDRLRELNFASGGIFIA